MAHEPEIECPRLNEHGEHDFCLLCHNTGWTTQKTLNDWTRALGPETPPRCSASPMLVTKRVLVPIQPHDAELAQAVLGDGRPLLLPTGKP